MAMSQAMPTLGFRFLGTTMIAMTRMIRSMIAKMNPALIVMCGISAIWSPRGSLGVLGGPRGQRRPRDARRLRFASTHGVVALRSISAILHL
ncbi:hypothetical protein ACFPRL_17775 [Pseudoclavibacter helvolus]